MKYAGRGYKWTYTRSAYPARGAMRSRDLIAEKDVAHACEICGETLSRKKTKRGIETLTNFKKRKTCGMVWSDEENKYILSDCLRKWRAIPKNNGRYIGLMHRKCKVCGKDGLSYVARLKGQKLPEMCIDCRNKNRVAHNKQETKLISCDMCGVKILNRWGSRGRLRKGEHNFCSKKCNAQFISKNKYSKWVEHECIVCGKHQFMQPSRARNRKTCSLSCNAKVKNLSTD